MNVTVKLDPKLIDALNRAKAKPDWRSIARRIEAMEGQWQLVENAPYCSKDAIREKRESIYQSLKAVGCVTQVVALQGMNINQRPWSGWAVFANPTEPSLADRQALLASGSKFS